MKKQIICLVLLGLALCSIGVCDAKPYIPRPPSVSGEALYPDPQGPVTEERIIIRFASVKDSQAYLSNDKKVESLAKRVMNTAMDGNLNYFTGYFTEEKVFWHLKAQKGMTKIVIWFRPKYS